MPEIFSKQGLLASKVYTATLVGGSILCGPLICSQASGQLNKAITSIKLLFSNIILTKSQTASVNINDALLQTRYVQCAGEQDPLVGLDMWKVTEISGAPV